VQDTVIILATVFELHTMSANGWTMSIDYGKLEQNEGKAAFNHNCKWWSYHLHVLQLCQIT